MLTPYVRFRLGDGSTAAVPAGGIIGRTPVASLRFLDPRVSEGHAIVSLRGRDLRLIALHGPVRVGDQSEEDLALQRGQVVSLAEGVDLVVEDLILPDEVLVLRLDDHGARELCASVLSLVQAPFADLVPRYEPEALAVAWTDGERWYLRVGGSPPVPVRPGDSWEVAGHILRAETVPLTVLATDPTWAEGRTEPSLRIVVRTTTAHIERERRQTVVIDGLPARLLTEVALVGAPIGWVAIAAEIWPDRAGDRDDLRRNWDRVLYRLRLVLRAAGVRDDLVRHHGRGHVEMFLRPGDQVVDEA